MKTALLLSIFLLAAPAVAKTVIIEYPDHYYVEVTGAPSAETAPPPERRPPPPARETAPQGGGAEVVSARPITDFDNAPSSLDPEQKRALMTDALQRLQKVREDILTPRGGETPEQAGERERQAAGMMKRINRMSAELLKMP